MTDEFRFETIGILPTIALTEIPEESERAPASPSSRRIRLRASTSSRVVRLTQNNRPARLPLSEAGALSSEKPGPAVPSTAGMSTRSAYGMVRRKGNWRRRGFNVARSIPLQKSFFAPSSHFVATFWGTHQTMGTGSTATIVRWRGHRIAVCKGQSCRITALSV